MAYPLEHTAKEGHGLMPMIDKAMAKVSVAEVTGAAAIGSGSSVYLALQDATIVVGFITGLLTCALVALKLVQKWREMRSGTPPRGQG